LAVALGVAYGSAVVFGVSLALGAFVAGLVVGESDLSHQAAADALPMRDAFAVLFFVSIGMLLNPMFLLTAPGRVLAVLAVIVLGNSLAALVIVIALGHPIRTALTVAAGLTQIGEFSFIVAALGRALSLLPDEGYQLILAGSLLSITLNPLLFRLIAPVEAWLRRHPRAAALLERRAGALDRVPAGTDETELRDHAVICGYGRVGGLIGQTLARFGIPYVVIEQNQRQVEALRQRGIPANYGDAANRELLAHTELARARVLVIALPDPMAARQIVEHARDIKPGLPIVVRTHSEQEWNYLRERATDVVLGEREAAAAMAEHALRLCDIDASAVREIVQQLRRRREREPRDPGCAAGE
jgi:CPA2 family monovalent cation:H+ antiporter-2